MLWSLIKIVLFIAAIAGLTLGAGYLMESNGGVRIAVADLEFNLGPLQAVIAAVLLVAAIWLTLKVAGLIVAVFRFLNGDETAISRYFDRNRERRGFEALTDGIMALASGDARTAISKSAKAEKYLQRPELTNLITAQAAELAGDAKKTEEAYKRLLLDDRTRFVGIRGIMKQKLANGETEAALALAKHAFALKPKHVETQDTLLTLQAQNEDWSGARKTLAEKLRTGTMPRDVHKRRDAVLALSEAREVFHEGSTIEAREAAIEANRLSPDLIPAAVMAARAYVEQGKPKYAVRVLKKAWESRPHPDLAAAFAAINPDEDPAARLKRFGALLKVNPQNPETRMLLAELNIAAEDFPTARRAIASLVETGPTSRSLALMAAVERGEGSDDAVVRGWLARALTASRGPQWTCDKCQHIHSDWGPVCDNCGGFDTLTWRAADSTLAPLPSSAEMLPVIVGTIAPPTSDTVPDAEIVDDPTRPESPAAESEADRK